MYLWTTNAVGRAMSTVVGTYLEQQMLCITHKMTYLEQQIPQALFSVQQQQQAIHLLTTNAVGRAMSTMASTGASTLSAMMRNTKLQMKDHIKLFSAG